MTDTDHTDHYVQLLADALEELEKAIVQIRQETCPPTPLPRPRRFEIAPGIFWPSEYYDATLVDQQDGQPVYWFFGRSRAREVARQICQACQYQPRLILQALRRIQAATAWCYARAEGRRRAAQEILRQQQAAQEVLEAEAALVALKS